MAPSVFNYCINTPSKRFTCLQKLFRHSIPFLLNRNPKRTNSWVERLITVLTVSRELSIY